MFVGLLHRFTPGLAGSHQAWPVHTRPGRFTSGLAGSHQAWLVQAESLGETLGRYVRKHEVLGLLRCTR